jgi:hypothetical protein
VRGKRAEVIVFLCNPSKLKAVVKIIRCLKKCDSAVDTERGNYP